MIANDRLQAVRLLSTLLDDNTPLTYLLQSTPDVSAFSKELCFGVCRHYIRLQKLADLLVTKRPKSTEIWVSILIGLYQLHYLNVADYAVVQETVAILPQMNAAWAKGLVNAVLRRYCREKETLILAIQKSNAFQFGHPGWLIKRLKHDWPEHWQAICRANDERPPMSLRINRRLTTVDTYLERLDAAGIEAKALSLSTEGIALATPCDVHDLPGFAEGLVSVQDEAAQMAASLLDLRPGLRILDACCAPGGKTSHLLELQADLAACIAVDVDAHRLKRVKANLARLQLNATVLTGDALNPASFWDGVPFDRILLDAPCSATGVIRRHPDIKLLRTPEDIQAIAIIQHALLRALWPLLSPGGLMIYATCSIMPEENELQIAAFLQEHANCKYLQPSQIKPWGHRLRHGIQILPGEQQMDGFFYSVLQKTS